MAAKTGGNPTIMGLTVVTSAGTRVSVLKNNTDYDTEAEVQANTLMGRIAANKILIQAAKANTGNIFVGDNTVVAATGVGTLAELGAGESVTLDAEGINAFSVETLFLDAATSGDGAYVSYFTL
jgi:hypothetical protein